MSTHFICQNSMTGAIHVLKLRWSQEYTPPIFSPCGYYFSEFEKLTNLDLKKKKVKVCIKCHNSLKKSHDKDLMARVTYLKLKGAINDRFKI